MRANNIGALIVTYFILRVPCYNYLQYTPKTLEDTSLIIQAPFFGLETVDPKAWWGHSVHFSPDS